MLALNTIPWAVIYSSEVGEFRFRGRNRFQISVNEVQYKIRYLLQFLRNIPHSSLIYMFENICEHCEEFSSILKRLVFTIENHPLIAVTSVHHHKAPMDRTQSPTFMLRIFKAQNNGITMYSEARSCNSTCQ